MPTLRSCGLIVAGVCLACGCTAVPAVRSAQFRDGISAAIPLPTPEIVFAERMDRGYILVLPGSGGDSTIDHGLVHGLKDADVNAAVELYDWTVGAPGILDHLRDLTHNRAQAQEIAAKIVAYEEQFPGRPVHLVGYSAGGGVAVLALESLPTDRKVTSAILLAPTLAYDYDLRFAFEHTKLGIHNFYSRLDFPLLMLMTTVVGTTEGRHTFSAGAVGFQVPQLTDDRMAAHYQAQLHQQEYRLGMIADGHIGGHFGWTGHTFVARHVAPLVDAKPGPGTSPQGSLTEMLIPAE